MLFSKGSINYLIKPKNEISVRKGNTATEYFILYKRHVSLLY